MAATYSGNPAASERDMIRFRTGDTDMTSALLQDAEIDAMIATETSLNRRLASCLEAIGRKLMRQPNFALDKWREDRQAVAQSFLAEAKALRKKATSQGVYAGGLTKTDKAAREEDSDRVAPYAFEGMDEYPVDSNPEADSDEDD
jgi:hypothetical protein